MRSTGAKIKEKIDKKYLIKNCHMAEWTIRRTLGPIISGTKWDRDILLFSAERGVKTFKFSIKKDRM